MKRSIMTRTYKSLISNIRGSKVSQIRTTNDYLILYLTDNDNPKNSTVIDIDVKNRKMLIKKKEKWVIISEKMNFGTQRFDREILKTRSQWLEEIVEKI